MSVDIRVQPTPNPNSVLVHVDRPVIEERMKQFNSADDAAGSPLAQALFAIDGVVSVFFMPNSITVSKSPEGEWDAIVPDAEDLIRSHFSD